MPRTAAHEANTKRPAERVGAIAASSIVSGATPVWDNLFMRYVVIVAFILILGSLASALVFLMKDRGKSDRTVNALALRVGFSIALFVLILLAYRLGWIQPTGIR